MSMWESQTNEKGQPLTNFEFSALCSAWLQTFGCLPPDDEAPEEDVPNQSAASSEAEPDDDTMLRMPDVLRLMGVSQSTIKRMRRDGRFPKPMRLSSARGQSLDTPTRRAEACAAAVT